MNFLSVYVHGADFFYTFDTRTVADNIRSSRKTNHPLVNLENMEPFIHANFMLNNPAAQELYHQHAAKMPIIDYHCHLNPRQIAENHSFRNLTEVWLGGDHYKWRAMRANGIDEAYITGDKPDYEKFEKWAATIPYAMRNPLYHWTHLELSRIFGIDQVLKPETAEDIYRQCTALLQTDAFRAQSIMKRCNVEAVCTTDDPVDSLEHHRAIRQHPFGVKVLPAWRPDKVLAVENPLAYNAYIDRLSEVSGIEINCYGTLLEALAKRHDFFASMGCKLSDHGLDTFFSDDYTSADMARIFCSVRAGQAPSKEEASLFKSGLLHELAVMDAEKGWVQQYHIGPLRNNNTRMFRQIGPDTGFDAINDLPCAVAGHRFFDRLDHIGRLAKTIVYNLNPKDNEVLATMANTFNDGSVAGKMQYGAGWWFLDQKDGMRKQLNTLSNQGLLSRFVGMLTDSRSFLSYPRHEYFRRILCNLLGEDIESGKLPASEIDFIGQMVEDICYNNAKAYFNF